MAALMKSTNVELRKLHHSDAEVMAKLANNKNISQNLRDAFPNPYTLIDAENFIKKCKTGVLPNIFGIFFNEKYVGNIGLMVGGDVYRKSAEIGYFIGEAFWNKGIVTKAVNLITEYGFTKLELLRIYTGICEYNTASMRVLEKCGYTKDAVFQKAVYKNNQILNEHRYSKINPKFNHVHTPFDFPKK